MREGGKKSREREGKKKGEGERRRRRRVKVRERKGEVTFFSFRGSSKGPDSRTNNREKRCKNTQLRPALR